MARVDTKGMSIIARERAKEEEDDQEDYGEEADPITRGRGRRGLQTEEDSSSDDVVPTREIAYVIYSGILRMPS